MIACGNFMAKCLKYRNRGRTRRSGQDSSRPRLIAGRGPKASGHLEHICHKQMKRLIDRYCNASNRTKSPEDVHVSDVSSDWYGEEKTVTILMADLRDFTPLADRLRPQEVRSLLNRYISLMITVIEHHHGTIVDFYGDGILVFFDGKHAVISERAAEAVECATEMQRQVDALSKENTERDLPAIGMGIGIHTGIVSVGFIGSNTRKKFGIVGSAVNETSRIQSLAPAGQIVVSESTRMVIGGAIELGPRFEAALKGFDGPRTLYPVHGIAAA